MNDYEFKLVCKKIGDRETLAAMYEFYLRGWVGRNVYCGFIRSCLKQYLSAYPSRQINATALATSVHISTPTICRWLKSSTASSATASEFIPLKAIFDGSTNKIKRYEM
jgi:hypothetical protein